MGIANVTSAWESGALVFRDNAGNLVMSIDVLANGVNIPVLTSASSTLQPVINTPAARMDAANSSSRFIWTAPAACTITKIAFQQSAVEATSATTTVMPVKVPSGTAVSAGSALLAAALNVKTGVTANTYLEPSLTLTTAHLSLVEGDSIGLIWTNGPVTEYIGSITITISGV